ncbi:MBOAT family O-acyltransferase [Urbifossiella limnaea]|uniref:Peptidoglycan O-acetyltransferase n=1 Tax=Urbifossiella limnaea TaxID=2528023 RepID=A0A517XX49_9BACT|nr:MBOAT family O-acyltransferase [Urbifossiella limnaea]QDU22080.1 Peptidoglycan O-acetyltransferase [Urbifossiella limnaea]
MVFATKAFWLFLPAVLVLYHAARGRAPKYRVLLAAGWLFYAWLSPQYLWVILLCTAIDYVAAVRIEDAATGRARRRWLSASVAANLGLLVAFKYTAFIYDNVVSLGGPLPARAWDILLPLGISFHTFQGIAYTVDVYRGAVRAVRSPLDYALFVSFFPQLAAGPVVRAAEFLPQMATPPAVTARHAADGLHFLLLGLFKKLLIADQLDALVVSPVFADPAAFGPAEHRWACLAWATQLYCDFSGYSDIAVGLALWFGFTLPLNFRFPYLATSVPDFWRRWHVSLSAWLRDYLYVPLGGGRGGGLRAYRNVMIVFVACGLWHGAAWAWLAFGVWNGLLVCAHRAWDRTLTGVPWADAVRGSRAWAFVAWGVTLWLTVAGMVVVRMPDWASGELLLRSWCAFGVVADGVPVWVPGLVALVALGHGFSGLRGATCRLLDLPPAVRATCYVGIVVLLVTLGPAAGRPFIYFVF